GRAGELAALGGGDDYELLFAADRQARATIEALGKSLGLAISRIGEITDEATHSVKVRNSSGAEIAVPDGGWRHF
ncbi:MAG: thiamine-phosphate kinase, partial [Rhodospirillaceae bacterium]|nr:thiamine-phosphate kinase [Rhodospirillaceae bacterium]